MHLARVIPFSLPRGAEMLEELTRIAEKEKITTALVSAIGALNSGALGYYDLTQRQYLSREFTQRMELISCTGNISLRDRKPWPHLHCVVSDKDGQTMGGHLLIAEVFLVEGFLLLMDAPIERLPDPESGLTRWHLP
ncbi:MAG: PPC domain-containing DNA-binding protein [bacterium]